MTVIIRKTSPDDAQELALIWLASLEDNPMVQIASPKGVTPGRLTRAVRKTLSDMEDPLASCLTACDSETAAIMGCAVWRYYPNGKQTSLQATSLSNDTSGEVSTQSGTNGTGDSSPSGTTSISQALEEASNAIFQTHVGSRPHAALCKLQVSPDHERKGVGSLLIKHGLEQTLLPSYHFSTPKAAKVYEKHGYIEIDRVVLDMGKYGGRQGELYTSPFYYRPGVQVQAT